jgi:poly(3-hydroxybutyrate) depolymerase
MGSATYGKRHHNLKGAAIALVLLLAISAACMFAANYLQHDGGNVDIEDGVIHADAGDIAYKLYVPTSATKEHPAPAVLLLHGFSRTQDSLCLGSVQQVVHSTHSRMKCI